MPLLPLLDLARTRLTQLTSALPVRFPGSRYAVSITPDAPSVIEWATRHDRPVPFSHRPFHVHGRDVATLVVTFADGMTVTVCMRTHGDQHLYAKVGWNGKHIALTQETSTARLLDAIDVYAFNARECTAAEAQRTATTKAGNVLLEARGFSSYGQHPTGICAAPSPRHPGRFDVSLSCPIDVLDRILAAITKD